MAAEISQRATSSSISGWRYDVFLSFRGETRLGFTDHLHSALQSKGLIVFRDEEKLERGENIRPSLWKAIQESEYKVIVFSKNYASSTWCLDELIEIEKCKGEKVLPVFYDVDPSHVRKQMDSFATAFTKHTENGVDKEKMNMWKDALKEVCDLAGWNVRDRHESEVVKEICSKIFYGLDRPLLEINDDLIGIEPQIKEFMTLLHMREEDENFCTTYEDVRFLGIWGIGGVGKTTLAEVIYNRISHRFDDRCFISNVKEKSGDLICLQQQLISHVFGEEELLIRKKICNISEGQMMIARMFKNRKVFIVLDNVDKVDQLEALAGKSNWFGKGSRILVTSRDSKVLNRHVNKNEIYEVKGLSYEDALQLFLLKAFNQPCHERSYVELAKDIVRYAGGLPLALKIFGSFLFDSTIEAWKSALHRLKAYPNPTIWDRLQISFEKLENLQKKLFLDIACFYKGECVDDVIYKLKALGHFPENDIPILESKCLIKISSNNKFEMHDLLQEMGHQIVYLESLGDPGKRSRLWHHEDIIQVLNNNTGTDAVEVIFLKLPLPKPIKLSFDGFSKMKNLRMLVIRPINFDEYYTGNTEISKYLSTVKWYGNSFEFFISNKLRILEWWGYPLERLPANFESHNLVELKMPMSNITELWDARKNFEKLKCIDMRDSPNLVKMPDLRGILSLEELNIDGSAITQLSSSIALPKKLNVLHIGGSFSRPVTFLPYDLPLQLKYLKKLNLSHCNLSDGALLNDIGCLSLLESLDLSGNNFTRMGSISLLLKLKVLKLRNCSNLEILPPKLQSSLSFIDLGYCPSLTLFSDPSDLLTSSEVLVAGGIAVNASYFGFGGKCEGARHVAQACINDDFYESSIDAMVSWGPTLAFDIPEWFNQKSTSLPNISGMFRFDFDVNVHLLHSYRKWESDSDAALAATNFYDESPLDGKSRYFQSCWGDPLYSDPDLDRVPISDMVATNFYDEVRIGGDTWVYSCWGYALFIVYEVPEVNSCQRNSSSTAFPMFVCELQVNNEDDQKVPMKCRGTSPKIPLAFRVPEIPSETRNGIWVFLDYGCFVNVIPKMWYYVGSCSITISSLNMKVKECGGRLVLKHNRSEFCGIIDSISTHGLECYDVIGSISPRLGSKSYWEAFSNEFWCGGPVRRKFVSGKVVGSIIPTKWRTSKVKAVTQLIKKVNLLLESAMPNFSSILPNFKALSGEYSSLIRPQAYPLTSNVGQYSPSTELGITVTPLLYGLPLWLKFLKILDLRNCNLSDGASLNVIGCLSLLECLVLSGNKFTRMDSISLLFEDLRLRNCSKLQALPPKLPSRLSFIDLENCPSLTLFF